MTEDKFLELVHEHKAQIYQHILYLLGNRENAEDITQETFIKAWEHRSELRPKTARAWMLKCAQNLCFNLLKRQKISGAFNRRRQYRVETALETLMHAHSGRSNPMPDEIVIQQELKDSVHCAIKKIAAGYADSDNYARIERNEFQRDCRGLRTTRRYCEITCISCPKEIEGTITSLLEK